MRIVNHNPPTTPNTIFLTLLIPCRIITANNYMGAHFPITCTIASSYALSLEVNFSNDLAGSASCRLRGAADNRAQHAYRQHKLVKSKAHTVFFELATLIFFPQPDRAFWHV